MSHLKLGMLWPDIWPYEPRAGVGLKLVSLPSNEEEFIDMLADYSCHPNASKRILSRIKENGFDLLTVMSGLNFVAIAREMKQMGVTLTIIPPQEGWIPRFPSSRYSSELMDKIRERNAKRNSL